MADSEPVPQWPTEPGQDSQPGRRGFALITVIWISGLLAVMAGSFAVSVRSHTLASANTLYNLRAEYIADGAALLAALRLAQWSAGEPPYALNGIARGCIWSGGEEVWIAVQDHGGLVDLNTASPVLLTRLLESLSDSSVDAADLAARIRDFRDPDSVDGRQQPEEAHYAGLTWRPKDAPFAVPEELDQIPGLTFEQFKSLRTLVTVQSQQTGIDPQRAPAKLLTALGIYGGNNPDAIQFSSPSSGRVFGIESAVRLKNGSSYVRQTVVGLVRQPGRPYATLSWQRGLDFPENPPVASEPCFN